MRWRLCFGGAWWCAGGTDRGLFLECDRAELAVAAALAPGDGGQLRSVLACFCGQHRFLVARQRKALPNPRPRSPSRMVCMGFSIGDSPQRDPQLFTATRTLFGRPSAMTSSTPTTIRQRLVAHRPEVLALAQRHGATNLRVYGSIAKGQEHPGSDLDLLVDLAEDQSLLGLIGFRQELEDLLGCLVDVTEAETLHPLIRHEILDQAQVL